MDDGDRRCCICLDATPPLGRTACCRHTIHAACLGRWHRESRTCPVCRAGPRPDVSPGPRNDAFVVVHVRAPRLRRRYRRHPAWLPALCLALSAAAYFAVRSLTG